MLRLDEPAVSFSDSIDLCLEGITGNDTLKTKLASHKEQMLSVGNQYSRAAVDGKLWGIAPIPHKGDTDVEVVGSLKKSELLLLYSSYFVPGRKPGRRAYDTILASAKGKCPYCGGIGTPRNIDHYIPKTYYPQFAILPHNLVPACRDCNFEGKAEFFATQEEDQVIHPYMDALCYFDEQWIFAHCQANSIDELGLIEYYVHPPKTWSVTQKKRAESHFNKFNLGLRFAKEAAIRLVIYREQMKNVLSFVNNINEVKECILQPIIKNSPFINHWETVMCMALMDQLKSA